MIENPIDIGFLWRQSFTLPDGVLRNGDSIYAEFRKNASDANAVTSIDGQTALEDEPGMETMIEGNQIFLVIPKEKTALFRAGKYVTNLVIERGSNDIPIGQIITITARLLPTRQN